MYHCADVDDVIMVTRPHLLLPHTMALLPSCCSAQAATALVTPSPLSNSNNSNNSNNSSSNMLDSFALDEAISNFRDVATSLDMTSGNGELLTDAQMNDVNTCPVSSVCMFAVQCTGVIIIT